MNFQHSEEPYHHIQLSYEIQPTESSFREETNSYDLTFEYNLLLYFIKHFAERDLAEQNILTSARVRCIYWSKTKENGWKVVFEDAKSFHLSNE